MANRFDDLLGWPIDWPQVQQRWAGVSKSSRNAHLYEKEAKFALARAKRGSWTLRLARASAGPSRLTKPPLVEGVYALRERVLGLMAW